MATTTDKVVLALVIGIAAVALPASAYMAWQLRQDAEEGLAERAEWADAVVADLDYQAPVRNQRTGTWTPVVVFWTKSGQRIRMRLSSRHEDRSMLGTWVRLRYDAWDPGTAEVVGAASGAAAEGTIVAFEQAVRDGFKVAERNHPVVEFTPPGGAAVRFTEWDAALPDQSRKGATVRVAYPPEDPSRAVAMVED